MKRKKCKNWVPLRLSRGKEKLIKRKQNSTGKQNITGKQILTVSSFSLDLEQQPSKQVDDGGCVNWRQILILTAEYRRTVFLLSKAAYRLIAILVQGRQALIIRGQYPQIHQMLQTQASTLTPNPKPNLIPNAISLSLLSLP